MGYAPIDELSMNELLSLSQSAATIATRYFGLNCVSSEPYKGDDVPEEFPILVI